MNNLFINIIYKFKQSINNLLYQFVKKGNNINTK
jgi:hypothetical protein